MPKNNAARDLAGRVGGFALMIGLPLLVFIVLSFLLRGTAAVSAWLYPKLLVVASLSAVLGLPLLAVLALIRKARGFAGVGFFVVSYIFGATLWVWALLLTWSLWGGFAVFVGLFLMGVGVVPVAMLATAFHGAWSLFGQLWLLLALTIGCRVLGTFLVGLAAKPDGSAKQTDPERKNTQTAKGVPSLPAAPTY